MPDCKQDANTHEWTVDLDRAGSGRRTMKTKHIVMATGFACRPKVPEVEGIDTFEETVRHSTEHDSSKGWEGKKIMVVGVPERPEWRLHSRLVSTPHALPQPRQQY